MKFVEYVPVVKGEDSRPLPGMRVPRWLRCWELYGIFVVAAFLRFFQLQTTEFDTDQTELFRMAHDAVAHGFIPLTSNNSSINILNPPVFLYVLMPAAALSAHPLGGAITIGLFTTATALLTYFFTRRYFGRFCAIVGTLLCVTATVPLKYSRGIWQPNILPFFVLLFLFFVYRGAVERRTGWFLPALAMFGIMYQLHPSTLSLGVLVLLAVIMAPRTVRWYEVALAVLALFVLLAPYILWEVLNHFGDVRGMIAFSRLPAKFDSQGLTFYRQLLYPDNGFIPKLTRVWTLLVDGLLLAGFGTACALFLRPGKRGEPASGRSRIIGHLLRWWNAVHSDRERSALLLLLVWQLVPLLSISRHAVALHMQYLLMFLPGPSILIALFLARVPALVRRLLPRFAMVASISGVALAALLICEQCAASTAYLVKMSSGHYDDRHVQNLPYVNDLHSLMHAFTEADQLAQARHLNRVYITMDANVQQTMTYLGENLKTPTTVFEANSCLVLPDLAAGPAVMLVGPYADLADELVQRFAVATLVDQPERLGGKPFRLYIVQPKPLTPLTRTQTNFSNGLRLLTPVVKRLPSAERNIATQWQIQRSAQAWPRVLYTYALQASLSTGEQAESGCALTSLRQGDQLIVTFHLTPGGDGTEKLTLKGLAVDRVPYQRRVGPLIVTSAKTEMVNWQHLHTATGQGQIVVPVMSE